MDGRASDLRKTVFQRGKVPLLIALGISLIYGVELYLAGSTGFDAAYAFVTGLPAEYDLLVQVVAPFLHSNHGHIGWNLVWFVPIGWVLLGHVDVKEFLIIFLTVSWITGSVAPWILAGGPNYGISGANAALAGWAVSVVLVTMIDSAAEIDSWHSPNYWFLALQLVIPVVLTVRMIGQSLGILSAPPGASQFGHFFGVIFGLVYGVYWFGRERGAVGRVLACPNR